MPATQAAPAPAAPPHLFQETTAALHIRAHGLAAGLDEDCPLPVRQLTGKIVARAAELDAAAAAVAAGAWAPPPDRPNETPPHLLRNQIGKVQGFAESLKARDEKEHFGSLGADLKGLIDLCRRATATLEDFLATAGTPAAAKPAAPACHAPPQPQGRILVVEDDAEFRQRLCELLEDAGYEAWDARNGDQAIRMLGETPFDLVLLDHGLPRKDGLTVLREMRSKERTRSVPVLMVSGNAAREVECFEAGAHDFLIKPIEVPTLRARVAAALHRRQLHLRELEQFFPPGVAREFRDQTELLYQGRQAEGISVLFADIRGFSRLSGKLGPGGTVRWVNTVMEELSECVSAHHGVLVDFIGDELMAMWGAPKEQSNHAALACKAALGMLHRLPELNACWRGELGEDMSLGIGISSGPAQVGNTGTRRRPKYGPLGPTVNLASRVQGASKYLRADLVVAASTRRALRDEAFAVRRLGRVRVVNIAEAVELYEVAPAGQVAWDEATRVYEEALACYERDERAAAPRDGWRKAAELLGRMIVRPEVSGPATALLARVAEALVTPSRWSPDFDLPGK